jgi:hypothetical protein
MAAVMDRDLAPDTAALMAACRLCLSPQDARALADLRRAAGQMQAVEGESAARARFRVAAQVCATAPGPDALTDLQAAMNEFNRAEMLTRARTPSGRPWRFRGRGGNGVAAAVPREGLEESHVDL